MQSGSRFSGGGNTETITNQSSSSNAASTSTGGLPTTPSSSGSGKPTSNPTAALRATGASVGGAILRKAVPAATGVAVRRVGRAAGLGYGAALAVGVAAGAATNILLSPASPMHLRGRRIFPDRAGSHPPPARTVKRVLNPFSLTSLKGMNRVRLFRRDKYDPEKADGPRYAIGLILGIVSSEIAVDYLASQHCSHGLIVLAAFAAAGLGAFLGYVAGAQLEKVIPRKKLWLVGRVDALIVGLAFAAASLCFLFPVAAGNLESLGWLIISTAGAACFITIYFRSPIGGFFSGALTLLAIAVYGTTGNFGYLVFAMICAVLSLPLFLYRKH